MDDEIKTPKSHDDSLLPTTVREFINSCKKFIKMARNGECSEDDIERGLARSCPKRLGYFRETDYLSADESMKVLGMNQNRNKFFDLLKIYKIKAHTFKGLKIGYYADDIYELNEILKEERKKERRRKYMC